MIHWTEKEGYSENNGEMFQIFIYIRSLSLNWENTHWTVKEGSSERRQQEKWKHRYYSETRERSSDKNKCYGTEQIEWEIRCRLE